MKEALYYDDIYLVPKYSELASRSEADTSVEFGKYKFRLPIIPSNMRGSINVDWAKWLSQNWYFYVMHRFDGVTVPFVKKANDENWNFISISTGVNAESLEDLVLIKNEGFRVDYITIDVAHGHHIKVKKRIQEIRNIFGNSVYIIAGNTSTPQSTVDLEDWGADATKCLIGTGSACSTKYQTGFHVPSFSCLLDCSYVAKKPIIADGGAKHYGDIAKAFVGGASMVMSGGMFASCSDSPAPEVNGKKHYCGNASATAKGRKIHVEGFDLHLEDAGISLEERLNEIKQALQSSISYAGGNDLSAFNGVKYVTIRK